MHKARRSNIRHSVSPRSSLEQARSRTRLAPNDAAGWVALAYALHEATEHREALIAAEKAITLPNAEASAWAVLGKLHVHRGDWDAALPHLQRSINLDPHCYEANIHLADLYLQQNKIGKALESIEAALEARPGDVGALSRKANTLMRAHRYDEAIDILENLVKVDPGNFAHWNNLGNARREMGMLSAAEDAYLKGMKVGKDPILFSNRLTALHYWPDMDAGSISAACKEWGATFNPSRPAVRPTPTDRSPSRPLRIGMFSDGFRQHPVGAMTTTALEHAAKLGIDVYAYTSNRIVDSVTRRMIGISTKWTAIAHLTDEQFADLIRDDEIDILIDLSGHNAGSRMRTMAMAPAPILVKWVGGLINTTGVEAIDYLISDGIESPSGTDDMYTEKLIRMPDDYICYMPPKSVPKVGPLPALKNGYVTFGCFNNPTKVNDVVLAEWAKLLQQVPNSRLYLKGGPYASTMLRQRVLDTLARHGIEADRVRMEGKSPHYQLFESYNEVDVALDPWPYSGGLTTCEAMLMGVPVVTLPGPTFAGRHSATHLINAGMPELVVENWDQYRDRVLELVSDLNSLATIRSHLRRVLLDSPVCDSKRFARNLANALRAIWQRYCEGKPPAALTLDQAGQAQFEDEPAPVELHHPPAAAADQDDDFSFSFTGDIVVLDQGGTVTAGDRFSSWHQLGAFTAIAIDPISMARGPNAAKDIAAHYLPNIVLGDGSPKTLYACLDASLSGTLEPLGAAALLPQFRQGAKVLAKLPISSIRLDDIQGLQRVDWMVLDHRHDTLAAIAGGKRLLSQALLIQARLNAVTLYEGQAGLEAISTALADHGFRLLRLHDPEHLGYLEADGLVGSPPKSQLIGVDAIYVPEPARLDTLSANQKLKLSFLLHTAYGCVDFAHSILKTVDESLADKYLMSSGWQQFPVPNISFTSIPSAGEKFVSIPQPSSSNVIEEASSVPSFVMGLDDPEASSTQALTPPSLTPSDGGSHQAATPIRVVDIGANPIDGDPPYKRLLLAGKVELVGFEPQKEALRELERRKTIHERYLPHAVGSGDEVTLYLCQAPGMTSTLRPNFRLLNHFHGYPEWAKVLREERIRTVRLDDVVEITDIDWLKIDIQGGELTVFRNGETKLRNTLVIQTEVNFIPLYENQPLFAEIDQWMRAHGFMLHTLLEERRRLYAPFVHPDKSRHGINQLTTADAVYIRSFESLSGLTAQQRQKMAVILRDAYGSEDLAQKILSST